MLLEDILGEGGDREGRQAREGDPPDVFHLLLGRGGSVIGEHDGVQGVELQDIETNWRFNHKDDRLGEPQALAKVEGPGGHGDVQFELFPEFATRRGHQAPAIGVFDRSRAHVPLAPVATKPFLTHEDRVGMAVKHTHDDALGLTTTKGVLTRVTRMVHPEGGDRKKSFRF
jgi:hypothetical protein